MLDILFVSINPMTLLKLRQYTFPVHLKKLLDDLIIAEFASAKAKSFPSA